MVPTAVDEPALARTTILAGWLAVAALAPLLAAAVATSTPPVREAAGIGDCPSGETQLAAFAPRNGGVSICPLGAATCPDGVRAESLGRTNIWKTELVTALSRSPEPLHLTLGLRGDQTVVLGARETRSLPRGQFAACVRDTKAGWLEISGTPAFRN